MTDADLEIEIARHLVLEQWDALRFQEHLDPRSRLQLVERRLGELKPVVKSLAMFARQIAKEGP